MGDRWPEGPLRGSGGRLMAKWGGEQRFLHRCCCPRAIPVLAYASFHFAAVFAKAPVLPGALPDPARPGRDTPRQTRKGWTRCSMA
eukprot:3509964-Alexandrium_andersonii.AAC.1